MTGIDLTAELLDEAVARPGIGAGALLERARRLDPLRPLSEVEQIVTTVRRRADGLAALAPALDAPDVDEVMVSADGVWVERAGVVERLRLDLSRVEVDVVVERILKPLGLRVDPSSPMIDARLPDGSRVNVVVPPLCPDGPVVTIRRFADRRVRLVEFCPDPEVEAFVVDRVRRRSSILVVGGTGAGKTTLLNALAGSIDPGERVITVEDTAELRLRLPHVVRLEARPANAEGVGAVPLGALLRNALRMRPDRLVVGEVRGAEAFDLLLALNTGHDGSMATCHAVSAATGLERLALLATMGRPGLDPALVRHQVATGIDSVAVVRRTAEGRRLVELADVVDDGGLPVAEVVWAG